MLKDKRYIPRLPMQAGRTGWPTTQSPIVVFLLARESFKYQEIKPKDGVSRASVGLKPECTASEKAGVVVYGKVKIGAHVVACAYSQPRTVWNDRTFGFCSDIVRALSPEPTHRPSESPPAPRTHSETGSMRSKHSRGVMISESDSPLVYTFRGLTGSSSKLDAATISAKSESRARPYFSTLCTRTMSDVPHVAVHDGAGAGAGSAFFWEEFWEGWVGILSVWTALGVSDGGALIWLERIRGSEGGDKSGFGGLHGRPDFVQQSDTGDFKSSDRRVRSAEGNHLMHRAGGTKRARDLILNCLRVDAAHAPAASALAPRWDGEENRKREML
ncbi:hypothetical protein K438DRAFT_1934146 [Mycena galopus ATCC 62051]|nr:hypothetical protein K438DRAFT_1934146 [Mycena galopus ATCC 62051]